MEAGFSTSLFMFVLFLAIAICIAIKLLLLLIRAKDAYLSQDAFPNGMKAGNAQLIGERDNQNNYFAILPSDDSLFAVIASGLTNKKTGKTAAIITVETLKDLFKKGLHKEIGIYKFFSDSFRLIAKRMNDTVYGNKVGATLIAVLIENGTMYYASAGDCALFLFRNGELINVNDINGTEIKTSKISLEPKDIAMLASRGAYESLTEMEILWQLSKKEHPYQKCQSLIWQVRHKRRGRQDNATVLVLEEMVPRDWAWGRDYGV